MQWLAQPQKAGIDRLHRHLDSEVLRASPGPRLSVSPSQSLPSVWASLSHRLFQCSNCWQLPDYVLIASRPNALGSAFPPLGLVYPTSIFCYRKTSPGTKHRIWHLSARSMLPLLTFHGSIPYVPK